ncbi:MAG: biotin/lipoyl-binding protein, partial [Rhodospirillales bacterium]
MPDTTDIDPRSDANASSTTDSAEETARLKARKRRFAIALVIGVLGTLFGGLEIHDRVTNIHEVDARIGGDLITVSSRVAGWVTSISVTEGDDIKPGSVLLTIDSRESALKARELEAQIASLRAEKDRTLAEKRLVDKETASKLKSEQAR